MTNQTAVLTAQAEGMYRCSGRFGETAYLKVGEAFPDCVCGDGGVWELRKGDNMSSDDAVVVFVGRGIIHSIETDELPEVGHCFNIREATGMGLMTGEHRVTKVESDFHWGGSDESFFWIEVERIGDLSPKLPIHQAQQMNV